LVHNFQDHVLAGQITPKYVLSLKTIFFKYNLVAGNNSLLCIHNGVDQFVAATNSISNRLNCCELGFSALFIVEAHALVHMTLNMCAVEVPNVVRVTDYRFTKILVKNIECGIISLDQFLY